MAICLSQKCGGEEIGASTCVIDYPGGCMWKGIGWMEEPRRGALFLPKTGEAGFHCCGELRRKKHSR